MQIRADKDYVIQTGFTTNFARTFLAGLLGLEQGALKEPVTLVVEDNAGSKARPTVFCRVESSGVRMTPTLSRETKVEALYDEVVTRFGFKDPYASEERDGIVFHSLEATECGVDFGVEVAVWGVVMANE